MWDPSSLRCIHRNNQSPSPAFVTLVCVFDFLVKYVSICVGHFPASDVEFSFEAFWLVDGQFRAKDLFL